MIKAMIAGFLLASSMGAMASNLDGLHKRFTLVKDDQGSVTMIKMNMFNQKLSIIPYVKKVKEDIIQEISRMNTKSFDHDLEALMLDMEASSDKNNDELVENLRTFKTSIADMKNVEIEKFFTDVTTKGVLAKFQTELQKSLELFSLSAIAKTDDARYFYKRNVTYEVVKRALDFAKKRFDSVPLLNLASFVIVRVHDLILEQRTFHQNMLLHYLQNFSEVELGLTKSEADKVFSSIYESRISPIMYRESTRAVNTWARYGTDKFYSMVRVANNRVRRARTWDAKGERLNYAFVKATVEGEKVIKNIIDNNHKFSGKMSTAYYFSEPNKVQRFRSLLNLGQIGLGFLPLPGWLKGQVESFVESYYMKQKVTEGALVGYFESNGDSFMAEEIVKQIGNPYLTY